MPTSVQDWVLSDSYGSVLAGYLPIYLIALPLTVVFFHKLPASKIPPAKLGGKNFFFFWVMALPILYIGNIIGSLLSVLISGGQSENALLDFIGDMNWLKLMLIIVIGPLMEEFVFRRLILDHTVHFGEKNAILLSALAFGLFHTNLYQFFYAFGLGLLFGYIYVRTGRLRYSYLLHMIINFMGSVIPMLLLSCMDLNTLETAETMEELAPFTGSILLMMGYFLLILAGIVCGIILLVLKGRKLIFSTQPQELSRGTRFKTIYLNFGMLVFVLLSSGLTIYYLFM